MNFLKSKDNIPSTENQNESEKRVSTPWNPSYDEYLKLRLDIPKGDEERVSKALESSYGRLSSVEQAQENLKYLKEMLESSFEDDAVYEMMNSEKLKYGQQKDKLGKKGFNSAEYKAADMKYHAFIGHIYKTTRGFLSFRAESLQHHIDEKNKQDQSKESESNQIEQIRSSISKL